MRKQQLRIVIEPDTKGYHAYCPELKGLHTCADTREDALLNAFEACTAYINSLKKHNEEVFKKGEKMKGYKVVLLKGTYNVNSLELLSSVTIVGSKMNCWWRVIRWIRDTGWKPPIVIRVAAIDSSFKDRARADYLCDGIKDEVEIQAALDYGR